MFDPYQPWPQGSFQSPVPIPTSAPDDAPLLCLAINSRWMAYLIGAAKQLALPSTWDSSDPSAVLDALGAAQDLIGILAEAPLCAVASVSGTYAGTCLGADVSVPASTLTTVLSLDVQPGDYIISARSALTCPAQALHMGTYLYQDSTPIAETQGTTPNGGWYTGPALVQRVHLLAAATFTLRIYGAGGPVTVKADDQYVASGSDVATCLEAVPLGISGPPGATGPSGPIVQVRFTAACGLETSTDGGTTWVAVPGWLDNAASCFAGFNGGAIPLGLIDPGAPPNPQATDTDQQACNIAAYLAQTVIRGAVNKAQSDASTTKTVLEFGVGLLALVPGIDIFEVAFAAGAAALYSAVEGGTLAHFTSAAADETLWAGLTCAIYGAIRLDGKVTVANFPAVVGAVAGYTYTYPDVITACALYLTGLGSQAVRNLQIPGALNIGDCSSCAGSGPWCSWWQVGQADICNGMWTAITAGKTATAAPCASNVFSSVNNGAGGEYVCVQAILPSPRTLTTCRVDYSGGALNDYSMTFYDESGAVVHTTNLVNWQAGTEGGTQYNVKRIEIIKGSGDTSFTLGSIKVGGPAEGSPWGFSNGVCD